MKKTLAFALWPEPPIPLETFNYARRPLKRVAVSIACWLAKRGHVMLVKQPNYAEEQRSEGQIWPGYADTMIGLRRLDNLQECVERVLKENVQGDLIEAGVWRGGACIFMRAVLAAYGVNDRKVYVADSFGGLPEPEPDKYPVDKGDQHHVHQFLAVSQQQVEMNFEKYGLYDKQVVFLKGWFKNTLPNAPIDKLAILRLDGDMYGSTMDTLKSLYPKLSQGGFCIVDDYALRGCKAAVDDYRSTYHILSNIIKIDSSGAYWRKE